MASVSIVIPMRNEFGSIGPLIGEIAATCAGLASFEIIVVDDGSTDGSASAAGALMADYPMLRLLRHDTPAGQSAAVHSGVLSATSDIVCTLDGDGQNLPSDLPKLYGPLLADTGGRIGLVAGQRIGRRDRLSRRLASRLANGLRGWLLQDESRDSACGLKGFRRDGFLRLPYFNHMHRYLPALFRRDGWQVVLVDVSHRPRTAGRSNYSNLQRGLVGIADLIGVAWLNRRRKTATAAEVPRP